jgi:hypothetical protein
MLNLQLKIVITFFNFLLMEDLAVLDIPIIDSEIISSDADTVVQDAEDDGSLYPYDPTKEDIDVREEPQTVHELVIRKWDRGLIKIDPEFQRNFVWKHEKMSQFIESVILNFPIPPLFFNQNIKGEFIVVDGRQRLQTLRNFLKNEFRLEGLNVLKHLNGKNFEDLGDLGNGYQAKIEDKKMLVYLIKPSVSLKVVYDIFFRINTGGTQLERQEIRQSLFQGKSTELLKKLSEKTYFTDAIGKGIKPDRMKDREAVLRCLAFRILPIDTYSTMSTFVETAMKQINKMDDNQIETLELAFQRTMTWSYKIFKEKNFRIPTQQSRGTVNMAVMESLSSFLSDQTDEFINRNQDTIRTNFFEILLKDKEFINAVQFSTGDKKRVLNRFKLTYQILSENTH